MSDAPAPPASPLPGRFREAQVSDEQVAELRGRFAAVKDGPFRVLPPLGWRCMCGRVFSPQVTECPHCPQQRPAGFSDVAPTLDAVSDLCDPPDERDHDGCD